MLSKLHAVDWLRQGTQSVKPFSIKVLHSVTFPVPIQVVYPAGISELGDCLTVVIDGTMSCNS